MTQTNDIRRGRRGRRGVWACHAHLVFVTKYRRDVFTDAMLVRCREVIDGVCVDFGCELVEFNGGADHVHLLINFPPTVQLSKLVNSLKGVSARLLRKDFNTHVRQYLWGGHFWARSYYVGTARGSVVHDCYIHSLARTSLSMMIATCAAGSNPTPEGVGTSPERSNLRRAVHLTRYAVSSRTPVGRRAEQRWVKNCSLLVDPSRTPRGQPESCSGLSGGQNTRRVDGAPRISVMAMDSVQTVSPARASRFRSITKPSMRRCLNGYLGLAGLPSQR